MAAPLWLSVSLCFLFLLTDMFLFQSAASLRLQSPQSMWVLALLHSFGFYTTQSWLFFWLAGVVLYLSFQRETSFNAKKRQTDRHEEEGQRNFSNHS
eukprot:gb/GEZN01039374.1/.p3 GENE.gb/GEZN01039374.1/~~gb/GEZN01039374.1/.p3  ORF type:complete len:107 (+),score=19.74 gb/GEZN01039374.1/:31-321(+)